MVKRFLAIVICGLMIFTGCAVSKEKEENISAAENIKTEFENGAHIIYKDLEAYAKSGEEENEIDIFFTSPEDLQEVRISLKNGYIQVGFKDISVDIDNDKFIGKTVIAITEELINSHLKEKNAELHFEGSSIIFKGVANGTEFELIIDTITGNFLKLNVPSENLKLEFNNFTIKK